MFEECRAARCSSLIAVLVVLGIATTAVYN